MTEWNWLARLSRSKATYLNIWMLREFALWALGYQLMKDPVMGPSWTDEYKKPDYVRI